MIPKKSLRLILATLMLAFVLLPAVANASQLTNYFPLVRCGTSQAPYDAPCTPCGVFQTGDRVVRFIMFGVTGPVAAFMLVLAGGMYLLGGANPAMIARAKGLITRTILGVTVILLAWVATNFLINTLGASKDAGPWYEFKCPKFLEDVALQPSPVATRPSTGTPQKPAPELAQAYAASCQPAQLAASYGTPASIKNSPALTKMRQCFESDPVVKALIKRPYTFDEDHYLCNYTRGDVTACGSCSHSQYSCHYGGQTGSLGAEAVDYNWNGRSISYDKKTRQVNSSTCVTPGTCRIVNSEAGLLEELYRAAYNTNADGSINKNSIRCPYKLMNYEGDHIHISTPTCDRDGTGLKGIAAPTN